MGVTRRAKLATLGSALFTSVITVDAGSRMNYSFTFGNSAVSVADDMILSTASAIVRLQRRLPDDTTELWRTVATWTVLAVNGMDDAQDNITDDPEPETSQYRLGIASGEHYAGVIRGRVGVN